MRHPNLLLITALGALAALAACGRSEAPADAAALAAERAELEQREADLAAREAALTAGTATTPPAVVPAETTPPASKPAPRPTSPKPAPPAARPSGTASTTPAASPPPAVRTSTVPAGTQLGLSLSTPLSSKNAQIGDTVRAVVTDDIVVDGRTAIAAGTTVAGQVIKVVSGSNKIGGVPTLGLSFDRLELSNGRDVPLAGEITQTGKSDNTRDTVKIVGGAAAGAILGNEIKGGDKGKVLGGLLGGAIGAVAAQKTGTEVVLAEGTALSLILTAPVEITRP